MLRKFTRRYPLLRHCSFGKKYGGCALEFQKHFEKMLITETPPDTVAAIMEETIAKAQV